MILQTRIYGRGQGKLKIRRDKKAYLITYMNIPMYSLAYLLNYSTIKLSYTHLWGDLYTNSVNSYRNLLSTKRDTDRLETYYYVQVTHTQDAPLDMHGIMVTFVVI